MVEISVVIPLYNKAPYIERAINSVFAQTFQDFEIIVVDDGSTDGGADLVKKHEDSRICVIQQENAGVSAARNRGITEAKGELIAFLDADDEWKPEFLEILLNLRRKYPEAGLYATGYEIQKITGVIEKPKFKAIPSKPWEGILPNYFRAAVSGKSPVWTSAVGVPKYVFNETGGFLIGEHFGEDVDMWGRIALKYPIAFSWKTGAIYHWESSGRACNVNVLIEDSPFIRTAKKAIDSGEFSEEIIRDLGEYIAMKQLDIVRRKVLYGDIKNAKKLLNNCKTSFFLLQKKKLFWYFWAMMPRSLTRLTFRAKWLFLEKCSKLLKKIDHSLCFNNK
jgi:glycosyltransferase involved in cell wall biosynthesis